MTKVGNIELFLDRQTEDGRLRYKSRNGVWELLVPVNQQTEGLTFRIEIELHTEQSYTA